MNGKQTTVIGVLPKSFDFGGVFSPGVKVDAITPLNLYGPPRNWGNIITFIGRLKPGVTLAQARQMRAAAPRMCWNNRIPRSCGYYRSMAVVPVPLKDYVSGKLRRSLVVFWSAVGAILLIACVNLSNLLLARAAARGKEFAMRTALGASRARIVRQLLTESLILSGAGALFGLGLASILVAWLAHQGAIALPLLSIAAFRRRGARLDGAHCRLCRRRLWPRSRIEDCRRQPAGDAQGLRPRLRPAAQARAHPLRSCGHRSCACLRAAGRRGPAAAQLPEGARCRSGIPAGITPPPSKSTTTQRSR